MEASLSAHCSCDCIINSAYCIICNTCCLQKLQNFHHYQNVIYFNAISTLRDTRKAKDGTICNSNFQLFWYDYRN